MNLSVRLRPLAAVVALVALASQAHAGIGTPLGSSGFGYSPQVPVSSLGQSLAWFDPSRFHVSSSFTVGSGFGTGTQAMQVTSLAYQFHAPVWMSVSLGNAWGQSTARGSSMFLEGLELGYRPFSNMTIQVHYQDFRSPLQYSNGFRDFRPISREALASRQPSLRVRLAPGSFPI
jgi:hypothetical protein